jgi:hypothetical protein
MKYFEKQLTKGRKKSSLGSNEFSPRKGPSFLRKMVTSLGRRATSLKNNAFPLRKGLNSLRNNHVPNFFAIINISPKEK